MKKIYIQLLDEGTTTFRPTQGFPLGGNIFRVLPTPDYNPENETWEFIPGSLVRCVRKQSDNGAILLAVEAVA